MKNTYSLDIHAPPERVFQWLGDSQRALRWVPNLVESEDLHVTADKVGSTFRHVYLERGRRMEMQGKVTAYEPNRRLTIDLHGDPFDLWVDYRLDELGSGTRLTQESEVRFKSAVAKVMGTLLSPLLRGAARRQQAATFGALQNLIESGTPE